MKAMRAEPLKQEKSIAGRLGGSPFLLRKTSVVMLIFAEFDAALNLPRG